jgi:hypothetical protein
MMADESTRIQPPKACTLVAAKGPDANSTITAAIATMLKATPVFGICYDYLLINMRTNSICGYHSWDSSSNLYKSGGAR